MATRSEQWIAGFKEAERQFDADVEEFVCPFSPGTPEYEGFLEGVYTFTQK